MNELPQVIFTGKYKSTVTTSEFVNNFDEIYRYLDIDAIQGTNRIISTYHAESAIQTRRLLYTESGEDKDMITLILEIDFELYVDYNKKID